MGRAAILFVGLLTLASNAASQELDFRIHDFDGVASLAASLRKSDFEVDDEAERLGLVVKGPTAPEQAQQPVLAQIKSRIEGIDITAGMQADRSMIREGPAQWVGGLGMAAEHDLGRHSIELRTTVGQNDQWGAIGLEVGPRLERRLPGGLLFVIDGKAEAQAARSVDGGWWSMPGTATDGSSMVGVGARTGLVR